MDDDTTSVTAALFGLAGFEVLAAADAGGELELLVQTTADLVGCPACGAVARAKDRRPSWVVDLPIGGRPVLLCWWERIWCCPHPGAGEIGVVEPVEVHQVLGDGPGQGDLPVGVAGDQPGLQPGAGLGGEAVSAPPQDPADAEQRILAAAAVARGVVLHAAAD